MRKACLVLIESPGGKFNYLKAFKRALLEADIVAEIVTIPFFMLEELTINQLRDIKNTIRARRDAGRCVIFCPGTAEIFLKEPNWSFVFSYYKSWDDRKVVVIPHVWTNITTPNPITPFKWTNKPALRIGFMGAAYFNSRVAKAASKSPPPVKKWLLQGHYLKSGGALALLNQYGLSMQNINTFPRSEIFKMLNSKQDVVENCSIEIVDTQFTGSEQEKSRYISHLEAMTYVICPRGKENFSIRVYEALKYGRIPVIIDTEMVLPTEIDWDQVAIRIPYDRLNDAYDIILSDYRSRSADEFLARQRTAFSTMIELDSMRWLASRLKEAVDRFIA